MDVHPPKYSKIGFDTSPIGNWNSSTKDVFVQRSISRFFVLAICFLDLTDLLNSLNSIEVANFDDFKWFNQPMLGDWMIWFIIKPVMFIKK